MKILILGCEGQLGTSLLKSKKIKKIQIFDFNKKQLDISNYSLCNKIILNICPDIIINAAAYTNVEQSEKNPELANEINYYSLINLSKLCNSLGIFLFHISTDYVFDGLKKLSYNESDLPNPLTKYGVSKLKGEEAIRSILNNFIILRVSWLYGPYQNNFFTKMIQLSYSNNEIKVVNDQYSIPTSSIDLANIIWNIINNFNLKNKIKTGIYHYSNSGKKISWFDFTVNIFHLSKNYLNKIPVITPITSSQFKSNLNRPINSSLNINRICKEFNIKSIRWQTSLKKVIESYFR